MAGHPLRKGQTLELHAGAMISLKVSPRVKSFLFPYAQTEVEPDDIMNLPPYPFCMKATGDEAKDVLSGQAVQSDEPSIEGGDVAVIRESRQRYAMPRVTAALQINNVTEGVVCVDRFQVKKTSKKVQSTS